MNRALFLLPLLACFSACAKYPSSGAAAGTVRLTFDMQVAGKIRTGNGAGQSGLPYVYIIALRLSPDVNPSTQGPIPVVTPGGNGFVAGNCTHYILFNPLSSPQYQIWQFSDATLNTSSQIGTPITYTVLNEGDRTLHCQVDLTQLVSAADAATIKSVQVNFLTMNNASTGGGTRLWDALGDGRISSQINNPVLVRLSSNQTYNNANQFSLEPTGDVADPDLDISDWSVQVQIQ